MPPSASDGCSDNEGDNGGDAENECDGLPTAGKTLLLDDVALLIRQALFLFGTLLLFLGELLLRGNPSLAFFGGVAEQGMGFRRRGADEQQHQKYCGFHCGKT